MKRNKSVLISLQSLGRETFLYIPAQLFPSLFGFIGLLIYTRAFDPTEYGDYSLLINLMDLIGVFTYSWINQSNLRFYQEHKKKDLESFYSTTFFILILFLSITSISLILLASTKIMPENILGYLKLGIFFLIITSFFETMVTIYRADRNPKSVAIIRAFSSGAYFIISISLIYFFDVGISAILLGNIITNIILMILISRNIGFHRYVKYYHFSEKMFKEFISYGFPIITTLLFSWILAFSDRYIIQYYRGSTEVGIYSAAYNLASYPMSLVSSMLIMAAFPIIIDSWENYGEKHTQELISSIIRYYLLIAVPLLTGIIVLSKEILSLLEGSYSSAFNILPWICGGSAIYGLCIYLNKGFELKKKTKILSFIVFISGISNVAMNIFLVPNYGFYGAGVSTCIAYMVYFIMGIYISKKYLNWNLDIYLISTVKIFAASVLMGASITLLKGYFSESLIEIMLLIGSGIIIYIVILIILNEVKEEVTGLKFVLYSNLKKKVY